MTISTTSSANPSIAGARHCLTATHNRIAFYSFCLILIIVTSSFAQKLKPSAESLPMATASEKELYTFDIARPVEHFDATPSGNLWYAVDKFALLRTITINGVQNNRHFNEIPLVSTKIAPSGNYLVYMGLDRSFDKEGFNTTSTSIFKHTAAEHTTDSLGTYHSDHNALFFSSRCDRWGAILPAANVLQPDPKDVVLLDGKNISSGYPSPRKFTFSSDCNSWAYRSTEGRDENVITNKGKQFLYKRSRENPYVETDDPIILHLSPDTRTKEYSIEGRDFDFGLRHTARIYKTSYLLTAKDTTHVYLVFSGRRQFTSRWISDVIIDTSGQHILYFANDTAKNGDPKYRDERALVVRDGKVIAGPYNHAVRLFQSPSGEHMAWTAGKDTVVDLYIDGKKTESVGEYISLLWSPDEKKAAYVTMTDRGKLYVVAGGKRSALYDFIGRVGFTPDGRSIEYVAIKYDKLIHVIQPL